MAQRFPRPEMVESAVAFDGPRNLKGWRAQQAHPFANLAIDGDHHLGPEQAVLARSATRRVVDVVAQEVARTDRRPRHPERSARDLVIEHVQTVCDHRASADGCEEGVCSRHFAAKVRPGLLDGCEAPAGPSQEMHDVGAVTEEEREEPQPAQPRDNLINPVAEPI